MLIIYYDNSIILFIGIGNCDSTTVVDSYSGTTVDS